MTKLTPLSLTCLALALLGMGVIPSANAPHIFTGPSAIAGNDKAVDDGNAGQLAGAASLVGSQDRTLLQNSSAAGIDLHSQGRNDGDIIAAHDVRQAAADNDHRDNFGDSPASGKSAALGGGNGTAFDVGNVGQVAGYVDFAAVHSYTPHGEGGTGSGSNNSGGNNGDSGGSSGQGNTDGTADKRIKPAGPHHGFPLPGGSYDPGHNYYPDGDTASNPDHENPAPESDVENPPEPESGHKPKYEPERDPFQPQVMGAALPVAYPLEESVAIPEPATYTLMLAGLGMLGFSVRRRKSCAT